MSSLVRTTSGLRLRPDWSSGNDGWTLGTGFTRTAKPSLWTWGKLAKALAPGASGDADDDGVREGQLFIDTDGTWILVYDAGNGTTGWRQFIATSTDRGLTWSRV